MQSITLCWSDGILHLDVPIEVHDAEIEVMVTLKAVTPTPKQKPRRVRLS